jgi:glycosyltransferase involved in cell wall biosynthesis
MRILIISNLYPPYYIGGYEIGCYDVVEALKAKGHEIKVLTSKYGIKKATIEKDVYRLLDTELEWENTKFFKSFLNRFKLLKKEIINPRIFKHLYISFKPDIIYAWKIEGISISIILLAQKLNTPIYFYVFDTWISHIEKDYWYTLWHRKSKNKIKQIIKKSIYPIINIFIPIPTGSLILNNVQFASNYLKNYVEKSDKKIKKGEVIYWGIDINKFSYKLSVNHYPKLLYVGQIVYHKGINTLVETMKILVKKYGYISLKLTIVGKSTKIDYVKSIQNLIHSYKLENNVDFLGFIYRKQLPHIYHEHDILIFPSIWEEPFGITIIEAMASGLAVVGTATGGSTEILEDGINSLVFQKEDTENCAMQIKKLLDKPALLEKIRINGRTTVIEKFNFENTIKKIENSLFTIIN